jgi:cytochrome P450
MRMQDTAQAEGRRTTDWFRFDLLGTEEFYFDALARKRRQTPVELAHPFADDTEPIFIAYRYADVARVVSDEDDFAPESVVAKFRAVLGRRSMLALGPRERRGLRSVLASVLSLRNSAALTEEVLLPVIRPVVGALRRDSVDLVAELTSVVPALVIARLLGMDPDIAPLLLRHSLAMAGYLDAPKEAIKGSRALRRLFEELVAERRARPGTDLVSRLLATGSVETASAEEPLADEDVIALLLLLAWAGTETAYPALGSLLFALLTHPDQLAAARASAPLARQAVDEALRWESPVQGTCRQARRDVRLGDVLIPAGALVFAHLGSANHDLPGLADPDRFDIWRAGSNSHLAFGLGAHRCVGIHLARMEMALTLELLLEACPALRLTDAKAAKITGHLIRGPLCLPVEIA